MSDTEPRDVSDEGFVDPYDFEFDEEAAGKYSEWERLLVDAGGEEEGEASIGSEGLERDGRSESGL